MGFCNLVAQICKRVIFLFVVINLFWVEQFLVGNEWEIVRSTHCLNKRELSIF